MDGAKVGPWELGSELGRGAVGRVLAAWGPDGEPAAVKLVERAVDLADEVWAMAQLDHPSIVGLLDAGRLTVAEAEALGGLRPGTPWLAMERGDGPLDGLRTPREWEGLRELLRALLGALAHAHARQVVHRDLKPRNVLWFGSRGWKLGDFGIAHALDRHDPDHRMNRSAGTPSYMAPEQLAGRWRDLGPWTDLYALGCLAWHVATGEPPFPGTDPLEVVEAHLDRPLPPFEPLFDVPAGFDAWLARLLRKRPTERWMRAADARRALDALDGLDPGPPIPVDAPAPRLGRSRVRTRPRLVGRDPERALLWSLLRRVHETGRTEAVVLAGRPGAGRSRLARWLQEAAHEVGVGWILEAPHDADGGPTTGLAYMLAAFLRSVGLPRAELEPRLAEILADQGFPDPALAAAAASFVAEGGLHRDERFRLLLASLAVATHSGRVATLLLDDAHWGEEALAFVRFLLRPEHRFMPVLAICTIDPAEARGPVARHLAAIRAAGATWIELAPVAEPTPVPAPYFAAEDDEADPTYAEDGVGATWVAPADGWDALLDGPELPAADRDALELAAALGQRLDRGELDAVLAAAGVAPSARWPGAYVEAGLLVPLGAGPGSLAFADPQALAAVAARAMDGGRWALRHAAVERALAERGAAPERVARHALLAGDAERACRMLAEAARAALALGNGARASELCALGRQALDRLAAPPDDPRRLENARLADEAARACMTRE